MPFTPGWTGDSLHVSAVIGGTVDSVHSSAVLAAASTVIADLLLDINEELEDANLINLVEDSDTRRQRKINLRYLAFSLPSPEPKAKPVVWNCTEDIWKLVNLAVSCSNAVYEKETAHVEAPAISGYTVRRTSLILPAKTGALKASALFQVERLGSGPQTTIIVAAIRGSASVTDWLINFDNCLSPCPDILAATFGADPLLVHRGFAKCARMLIPLLAQEFASLLGKIDTGDVEIILTGHSAGGAVAALIYAHFLTSKLPYPMFNKAQLRFSCMTFGAPPIFSASVTPRLAELQSWSSRRGLMLAFVVEGDPVARMDAAYAKLIAYLYYKASADEYNLNSGNTIELPPLSLFRLGKTVLLADDNGSGDGLELNAYLLREEDMSRLLWADLFAHKKMRYLEWIRKLAAKSCKNHSEVEDVPLERSEESLAIEYI